MDARPKDLSGPCKHIHKKIVLLEKIKMALPLSQTEPLGAAMMPGSPRKSLFAASGMR